MKILTNENCCDETKLNRKLCNTEHFSSYIDYYEKKKRMKKQTEIFFSLKEDLKKQIFLYQDLQILHM